MKNAIKDVKRCSFCNRCFGAGSKYLVELFSKEFPGKVNDKSKLISVGLLCPNCHKVAINSLLSKKDFLSKVKDNSRGNIFVDDKCCSFCNRDIGVGQKYFVELFSMKVTKKGNNESELISAGLLCPNCHKVVINLLPSRERFWVEARGNSKEKFFVLG